MSDLQVTRGAGAPGSTRGFREPRRGADPPLGGVFGGPPTPLERGEKESSYPIDKAIFIHFIGVNGLTRHFYHTNPNFRHDLFGDVFSQNDQYDVRCFHTSPKKTW